MSQKKHRHQPKKIVTVQPVPATELENIQQEELSAIGVDQNRPNIFIGTLNIIAAPMRPFIDPVKKVCYPRLTAHWEEKYKNRFPRHAKKILLFDLVLLFLISALVVSLVLVYKFLPASYSSEPISISLQQPTQLTSGAETKLIIGYVNGSTETVREAQLLVETSKDFIFDNTDNSSSDSVGKIYNLRDLPAYDRGQVTIPGRVYGAPGKTIPLTLRLTFWKSGRAESTTVSTFYELPIVSSTLRLDMKFEKPPMVDTINAIQLEYENQSQEILRDVVIHFSRPPEFIITGALPALTETNTWRLGNLAAGARSAITVYGMLRPGSSAPSFSANSSITGADDQLHLINEARLNTDTLASGLLLSADIANSATILSPGQTVEVTIKYANTGQAAIKNMTVTLKMAGKYLADDQPIVWQPAGDTPELANIAPGTEGTLTKEIQLAANRTAAELNGQSNQTINFVATAEYSVAGLPTRIFHTDSGVSELPVSTALQLTTAALYSSAQGDQLGSGPVPPQVGEKTKLWVTIDVKNSHHAIRNARVQAGLTPLATWLDKTSVSFGRPLAFIIASQQVIWELGDLPAFAGDPVSRASASFEVEVQPTKTELGLVPTLLDHIIIEGEDAVTGAKVVAVGDAITTAVRFGSPAAQSGIVIN